MLLASAAMAGVLAAGAATAAPMTQITRVGTFDNGGETNA